MPAISPRSFAECNRLHHEDIQRLAQTAFDQYMKDINTELYVYGQEYIGNVGTGYGKLTASHEAPDDTYDLIITNHIPRCMTRTQLYTWIQDRLRRTPLAAFAD